MNIIKSRNLWKQVKEIKSAVARKVIPEACFKRSLGKAMLWYAIDLSIFLFGMALVFFNPYVGLKLVGGLISGTATAMLFVWAHDAAHGTLFKSSKVAEVLGTLVMLPSLNIYRMWSYGHNKVHHGFTSLSPIDWIWRPLTPAEYRALSLFQRILYRVERSAFTCAFHYLRRIWWSQMLKFNPGKDAKQRRYYRNGKLMVLAYTILASAAAYIFAGGLVGILMAVVVPFIVFNYFISMIVYLHHTHPNIPFFDLKQEWSHSIGALYCSTIIHCSKLSKALLHNIMVHIPHHLDTRIPFYHLPEAYEALKEKYGTYFHEYQFKWSYVGNIFKKCKLYDFEKKVWMTFEEGEQYQN
jgi:omega-6 fatty acid desaturase (delta-12 desaturase)|tara:strand:+ start:7222 stop:8283 length:1062 start_codon:yes stop_codon:yes gene_type:complete